MLFAVVSTLEAMTATASDGEGHQQGGDDDRLGRVAGLGVGSEHLVSGVAGFGTGGSRWSVQGTQQVAFLLSLDGQSPLRTAFDGTVKPMKNTEAGEQS